MKQVSLPYMKVVFPPLPTPPRSGQRLGIFDSCCFLNFIDNCLLFTVY
jgi:hypothetical protein